MEHPPPCQRETAVNKSIKKLVCLLQASVLLALPFASPAQTASQDASLCRQTGVTFAFFNGVLTTKSQAEIAKQELKRIHGNQSPNGDEIKYETLYNYTSGFEDFVETFDQRLNEQQGLLSGRFELFFESLRGGGTWWSNIIGAVAATSGLLDSYVDWHRAATAIQLGLDNQSLGHARGICLQLQHFRL